MLRGVFLGRPSEVDWFLHGLATVFPDAHAQFVGFLPERNAATCSAAISAGWVIPSRASTDRRARAWSIYEGSCSTLLPSPDTVVSFAEDRSALGLARIEAHYFANDLFLPPEGLLGHMHRIGRCAGRDRAGPLRHGVPADQRLRSRRRLARRAADRGAGCGTFGFGAGHAGGAVVGGGDVSAALSSR